MTLAVKVALNPNTTNQPIDIQKNLNVEKSFGIRQCVLLWVDTFGKYINPLPNDKIFCLSKLKAFADDKINETQKLRYILEWIENIVGKGENAGYQHFLLFPQCFQKSSFSGSSKGGIVW